MFTVLMTRAGLVAGVLAAAVVLATTTSSVHAQTPTGTISGRVYDSGALAVPGATVTIASPNLQGTRSTITSANGDYIFRERPAGRLHHHCRAERICHDERDARRRCGTARPGRRHLAARGSERGRHGHRSGRCASPTPCRPRPTSSRSCLATLPTARTILSAVNLSPGAHATGPNNDITIGGAMSCENLFMLNGVADPGQHSRHAASRSSSRTRIQETTVVDLGHFRGIRTLHGRRRQRHHEVRRQQFSGSLRTTFTNDDWRTVSAVRRAESQRRPCPPTSSRSAVQSSGTGPGSLAPDAFSTSPRPTRPGYTRIPYSFTTTRSGSRARSRRHSGRVTTSAPPTPVFAKPRRTTCGRVRRRSWTSAACTRGSCRRTWCRSTTPARSNRTSSSRRSTRRASSRSRTPVGHRPI